MFTSVSRALVHSGVGLCVTPWTVACQATLSMEVSRQEYFSGLSFPPPGRALSCKQETLLYSGCLKQKRDLLMGMRKFEYLWKGWRTKHRDKLSGKMPKIYLRAVPEDKPLLHVWAMMLQLIQMMPPTLSPKYYHQKLHTCSPSHVQKLLGAATAFTRKDIWYLLYWADSKRSSSHLIGRSWSQPASSTKTGWERNT